jgi:hypothetical protein
LLFWEYIDPNFFSVRIIKPRSNILLRLLRNLARETIACPHRKKKVREFPVPSRDVTTKLYLGGNNEVITELLLPRGSLVSDIPARDGKLVNLFLRCRYSLSEIGEDLEKDVDDCSVAEKADEEEDPVGETSHVSDHGMLQKSAKKL